MDRPTLCLLPGLDGTGRLYDRLRTELADFPIRVLAYERAHGSDYATLARELAPQLPATHFVLIAESFAGPLGVMLASQRPSGLRALVLAASFVTCPTRFKHVALGLLQIAPSWRPPVALLMPWLAGPQADEALRSQLESTLAGVPLKVLRARARSALHCDEREAVARVEVPLLSLRASRDRIVRAGANLEVMKHARLASCVSLDAPHFLFQTAASEAANAIRAFLRRHGIY